LLVADASVGAAAHNHPACTAAACAHRAADAGAIVFGTARSAAELRSTSRHDRAAARDAGHAESGIDILPTAWWPA